MILIKKPYIVQHNEKSRCCCDILINDDVRTIWFEVPTEYAEFFSTDRADAYVIGLLNWAMRENQNIICEVPITEELYYNIVTVLIPSLCKYSSALHEISIQSRLCSTILDGNEIGTGCSCGIDSFDAIKSHLHTRFHEHDLTLLCINNVGAFNDCYDEYGVEKVRQERYKESELVSKELALPLLKTDSNFSEAFPQNHLLTNTYSSCFAIYMLQKMWKKYYLASVGVDYGGFSLKNNADHDSAYYDLLTLQCFSTSGLRIYSEGGEKSRLEKTDNISDFITAQKHLHVCIRKPNNCGKCTKCRRTLVTLDLLGKLDDFRDVFNVDEYKSNRREYYEWLYLQYKSGDEMNKPVYLAFSKNAAFRKILRPMKIKYNLARKIHLNLR